MPRGVKKQNLPDKPCQQCGRPFTWRKKWANCWEEVKYCSDRCRNDAKKLRSGGADSAQAPH
ncbi:MAG: DUF2256 domain-containing protein [Pseudomonadota bacterium]